jgi:hypothetical protein
MPLHVRSIRASDLLHQSQKTGRTGRNSAATARGAGVLRGGLHGKPVREADRIRAYELLLAYGWGKPAEFAAIEGADPLEMDEVTEAIASLVDELARKRAAE